MLHLLLFGSSHRRGHQGWTDRARVRRVVDLALPDFTVDGASPAGGADQIAHEEASAHFLARGLSDRALRCPVDHAQDGPWPAAGHRRNERQYRTHRPTHAAGFISGPIGSAMSSGSAGMARICREGLRGVPPIPLVIFRDNGVEAVGGLVNALALLRLLYRHTPEVEPAGKALRAALDARQAGSAEVEALVAVAREALRPLREGRAGPWVEVVAALISG